MPPLPLQLIALEYLAVVRSDGQGKALSSSRYYTNQVLPLGLYTLQRRLPKRQRAERQGRQGGKQLGVHHGSPK